MFYHGRNLIITANGKVIAGAKSCDISVKADTIEVSSASDGAWEHSIVGRKSWQVSTNHLLGMDVVPSHTIEAVGCCHKDGANSGRSYVIVNGIRYNGGTRGLQMRIFEWSSQNSRWQAKYDYQYDTYSSSQAMSDMASDLASDAATGDLVVITSYDAYALNSTLQAAISNLLGIPSDDIPEMTASRASFVAIGIKGGSGISFTNANEGSSVHARLLLDSSRAALSNTPMKSAKEMVGTVVTLRLQADGLADDQLVGQAIVRTWKGVGSLGNLATGSFAFEGSGPLE